MMSLGDHLLSSQIGLLIECALELGVSFETVCAHTALTEQQFRDGAITPSVPLRVQVEANILSVLPAATLSRRVAFAMARKYPIRDIMFSFRSLRELLDVLIHYQELGNFSFILQARHLGPSFRIVLEHRASHPLPDPVFRYAGQTFLVALHVLLLHLTERPYRPLRLGLPFSPDDHARELFAEVTQAPLATDEDHFFIEYESAVLDWKNPHYSSYLANRHLDFLKSEHALRVMAGPMGTVIRTMLRKTPGLLSLADMARRLNLSEGAIKHRLRKEGETFSRIQNEELIEKAIWYLQNTGLTQREIADLLGFSNLSNFRRSFTMRTGAQPADYRRRPAAGDDEPA